MFIVQGRTDPAHAPATLRALRFGEAAQRAAFMNAMADPAPAPEAGDALVQLRREIEDVEKDIGANERWEGGRPCGAEAQRGP